MPSAASRRKATAKKAGEAAVNGKSVDALAEISNGHNATSVAGSLSLLPHHPTDLAMSTDGAGDVNDAGLHLLNKRMELPPTAYSAFFESDQSIPIMKRGDDFVTIGKAVKLSVNTYNVMAVPSKPVFQYQVTVGNGNEKFAVIKKVWNSNIVQSRLGRGWLFDNNALAWSLTDFGDPERKLSVNLDDPGQPPKEGRRSNCFDIRFKRTKRLDMASIEAYLAGRASFSNSVLEAINFLDHLLRQWPSERLAAIRQSFYNTDSGERQTLGLGVEAVKGVFQSMRMVQGGKLSVHADVSNGVFWVPTPLLNACFHLTHCSDAGHLTSLLKPDRMKDGTVVESVMFNEIRRLRRVRVICNFPGAKMPREYVVDYFLKTDAKTTRFSYRNRDTGEEKDISIEEYFRTQYDYHLKHPFLPIVQTTKSKIKLPIETLTILPNQKYNFKLNEEQTKEMIKFAATPPAKRKQDIENGLKMLNWGGDPYFKHYGLAVSNKMIETKARLLDPPTIQFAGTQTVKPGLKGKWNLMKVKFLHSAEPLKYWTVVAWRKTGMTEPAFNNFKDKFLSTFQSHGGRPQPPPGKKFPLVFPDVPLDKAPGQVLETVWENSRKHFGCDPQIVMLIVPDKSSWRYLQIKKSMDCRWKVVSQVVQGQHAQKAQGAYLSNVCMKFATKLGGTTSRIGKTTLGHFKVPTMVLGADVSHASPGLKAPSISGITVSQDLYAARYSAHVEVNGSRREEIIASNFRQGLRSHIERFIGKANGGNLPEHIWYLRDGVSDGAFQNFLETEVKELKSVCRDISPKWNPKLLIIMCSKRHHIRFFPHGKDSLGAGDGNPNPGVLVDRDVTHTFENDAYLCTHMAIKGTARPCHYQILVNETGLKNNEIYKAIYEQCYTFCRSTTPISLHPAVYYAHLACARARAHEFVPSSEQKYKGVDIKKSGSSKDQEPEYMEHDPLLSLDDDKKPDFKFSMWFV